MHHDLTSLQLFVTVAECGNLTRAAERAHLAVSAISKRMAEMEAQAGTPLLQRFARGVGLTPAGQSLLHHARRLLQVMREMDAELTAYAGGIKGHVRLQAVASALTQFLPEEIEGFLSRYPQVQLSVEERTSRAVVRAVAEGAADLGVITGHTALQGLTALPYHRDRLVLAVPPGHALARRRGVRLAEALAYPLVGPQPGSALAQLLEDGARAAGLPLPQRVQASSFEVMARLVEARLGVTVLPEGTVRRAAEARRLRLVPLREPWAERQLMLVVRDLDECGHIARTFIEHLQRAAGTWGVGAAEGPAAG